MSLAIGCRPYLKIIFRIIVQKIIPNMSKVGVENFQLSLEFLEDS